MKYKNRYKKTVQNATQRDRKYEKELRHMKGIVISNLHIMCSRTWKQKGWKRVNIRRDNTQEFSRNEDRSPHIVEI